MDFLVYLYLAGGLAGVLFVIALASGSLDLFFMRIIFGSIVGIFRFFFGGGSTNRRDKHSSLPERNRASLQREKNQQAENQRRQRIENELGKSGAALLKRANSAVDQVAATEAAQSGRLGDIDFAPDIGDTETSLRKVHALRAKANELAALDKRTPGDQTIIAEATNTAARLEIRVQHRVELLEKCAAEAKAIDQSLLQERKDEQLADRREELHGDLAAMLYGAEADRLTPRQSAAESGVAQMQAYRELKHQIDRARESEDAYPPSQAPQSRPDRALRHDEWWPATAASPDIAETVSAQRGGCQESTGVVEIATEDPSATATYGTAAGSENPIADSGRAAREAVWKATKFSAGKAAKFSLAAAKAAREKLRAQAARRKEFRAGDEDS